MISKGRDKAVEKKKLEMYEERDKYRHIASEVIRAMNGQSGVDQRLNQSQQDRLTYIIEITLRNKLGYYERY